MKTQQLLEVPTACENGYRWKGGGFVIKLASILPMEDGEERDGIMDRMEANLDTNRMIDSLQPVDYNALSDLEQDMGTIQRHLDSLKRAGFVSEASCAAKIAESLLHLLAHAQPTPSEMSDEEHNAILELMQAVGN